MGVFDFAKDMAIGAIKGFSGSSGADNTDMDAEVANYAEQFEKARSAANVNAAKSSHFRLNSTTPADLDRMSSGYERAATEHFPIIPIRGNFKRIEGNDPASIKLINENFSLVQEQFKRSDKNFSVIRDSIKKLTKATSGTIKEVTTEIKNINKNVVTVDARLRAVANKFDDIETRLAKMESDKEGADQYKSSSLKKPETSVPPISNAPAPQVPAASTAAAVGAGAGAGAIASRMATVGRVAGTGAVALGVGAGVAKAGVDWQQRANETVEATKKRWETEGFNLLERFTYGGGYDHKPAAEKAIRQLETRAAEDAKKIVPLPTTAAAVGLGMAAPATPQAVNPVPDNGFQKSYDRNKVEDQKSQFMKFGELPQGFEYLPGNKGRLGMPQAVAATGAMPLAGETGTGGSYGGSGGYSGGGGGDDASPVTPESSDQKGGTVNPGEASSSGASKRLVNVPVSEGVASVRYNNPGAAYPSAADEKFGIEGYGKIGGGHKIGKFPTVVHGAAANMALWQRGYVGMNLQQAVNKWRGGNGSLNVPEGFDPNMKLTQEQLNDKDFMVRLFKGMSKHEAGRKTAITDEQWSQAHDMFKAGGVEEYKKINPDFKPEPLAPRTDAEKAAPPEYDPNDVKPTPEKIAEQKGLIPPTDTGEDARPERPGQEEKEKPYKPTGLPQSISEEARRVATLGPTALKKYMREQGHPQSDKWCGDFAASVISSQGGKVPKDPSVASNWRNYGVQVEEPMPGDIAVKRNNRNGGGYVRTGGTGSHVNIVDGVDGKKFTAIGGNQSSRINQFNRKDYEFFRALPPKEGEEQAQAQPAPNQQPVVQPGIRSSADIIKESLAENGISVRGGGAGIASGMMQSSEADVARAAANEEEKQTERVRAVQQEAKTRMALGVPEGVAIEKSKANAVGPAGGIVSEDRVKAQTTGPNGGIVTREERAPPPPPKETPAVQERTNAEGGIADRKGEKEPKKSGGDASPSKPGTDTGGVPSNWSGTNHPETQGAEPGSGGYGSCARCFV